MTRSLGSSGLAARIMHTTLVIGVVTVFTAGVVAAVSTARLSSRQVVGRDLALAQLFEDRLKARLDIADETSSRIGEQLIAPGAPEYKAALASFTDTDSVLFERVLVLDAAGTVLADSSDESTPGVRLDSSIVHAARTGLRGFMSTHDGAGEWQLWSVWSAPKKGASPIVVLAELDKGFIRTALRSASSEGRHIMLVEQGRTLESAGDGDGIDLSSARWIEESRNSGRVSVSAENDRLQGTYIELTGTGALQWRFVALTPALVPLRDMWVTVLPSIAVLLVGGTVALVAAWSMSSRVVRPLRDLERAARVAASGSYVKPLAVAEDDELGRVAQAFNQVSVRLNALHDLSQLLASANDVDQVLDGIIAAMDHLTGSRAAAIYLLDEASGDLMPARTSRRSSEPVAVHSDGDELLARALRSDGVVTLDGAEELERQLPGLGHGYRCALAAPLVAGYEPLGVVVALRDDDRDWSDAEQEMVRTFSAHAAVAVQSSRLFEFESRSRRVAEALRSVAEELVRPEGLEAALRRIEEVARELFEAASVSIVVVDRPAVALKGAAPPTDSSLLSTSLDVLGAGDDGFRPVRVTRGVDPRVDALLEKADATDLLVVPVALDTDHGAIMVIAGGPTLASPQWQQVASAIADELALALDNAYFYERALTRAANLETIFRISQAVGSSLQVNVVLNRVLDVVQKILSADAVALLEYDPRRKSISTSMARGDVPPSLLRTKFVPGDDLPGYVFSSGEPATLRDLHAGMQGIAGDAAANELRALLAVPLLARGRSIGVLIVFSNDAGAFSREDRSVLQTFASQAALAIDTARLYSREHEVATVLQHSILPAELPEFAELTAGSVYAPAGADAEIGGDYYDLFSAPNGDIWFAIADVCGKGVHAATRTSMIKYGLQAFAAAGLSPAQVLSGLNRMVAERGSPSDIVTVWVGRLDRSATRLTWANGGHPPGVLRRTDGRLETLEVTGPLLGAIPEVPYDEMWTAVAPGDSVLLYTDGVTEARTGNIFFGEQRVRDLFTGEGTAGEQAADLLTAVRRFSQGDLRDDVAVLVVSLRRPDPESHE